MRRWSNYLILALPFLVAAYPVLEIFSDNQNQLAFRALVGPLFVSFFITAIVLALMQLWLRNPVKTSLATSLVMADGLFYLLWLGRYEESVQSLGSSSSALESSALFTGLVIAATVALVIWIWRSRRSLRQVAELALVVVGALVALVIFSTARYALANHSAVATKTTSALAAPAGVSVSVDTPDVYYIILDRYAAGKTLADQYHFDNSAFYTSLQNKGFFVASDSHANYPFTIQSLASSLNGSYLPTLNARDQNDVTSNLLLNNMIQNNGAAQFFTTYGYKYINLGSWWDPTGYNALASVNLRYKRGITLLGHEFLVSDFGAVILRQSLLAPILDKKLVIRGTTIFATSISAEQLHRDNALYELDQLSKLPTTSGPKFVFAHILLPHPPYVFNAAGNEAADADHSTDQGYINQLEYTNKRVEQLVGDLVSKSAKLPVIVLQADEGPYPARFDGHTDTFNWNSGTGAELQKKTGILNAYYLPGVDTSTLSAGISPVNTFRLIINHYFGGTLPLLPDKHYIDNSWTPYKFIDITDKVGQ